MKKSILISGTSFVMPNSNAWNILESNFKLNFLNFDQILLDNSDYFVFILNFKDIINFPVYDLSNTNLFKIKKKINIIFRLIKKKSTKLNQKIILVIDFFYSTISLRKAKRNNFEEKIINYINFLLDGISKNNNFYYIFLDESQNKTNYYDNKFFILAKCRYSFDGLSYISSKVYEVIKRLSNPAKKVLILDCDNTLWGGVVGEDGPYNIQIGNDGIGNAYRDFQSSIKRIKNEGIILAISSKNNQKDIEQVFNKNKNMVLSLKDFACIEANWNEKSDSILQIAKKLNLSLDSFAFFDDNILEREQIKKKLKQLLVIEPDDEISNWADQIFNLLELNKLHITEEDRIKTEQYKTLVKFEDDKNKNRNHLDFLKSLKLEAKLISLDKSNLPRAIQLIQKTNQFNLRTVRYNEKELLELIKSKNLVYLVSLKDKYGDHGIVGIFILRILAQGVFIDNIAISCRVLGRNLETWILDQIKRITSRNKLKVILGEFIKTDKNVLVENFYKKFNFSIVEPKKINSYGLRNLKNKNAVKYISTVREINTDLARLYK
jgi:FkbH-like protein